MDVVPYENFLENGKLLAAWKPDLCYLIYNLSFYFLLIYSALYFKMQDLLCQDDEVTECI